MSFTMDSALVRARSRVAERLALDLDRIRKGIGPTADELAGAPVIDDWITVPYVGTGLRGRVSGLPGLVNTSELFVLDREQGYCRTFTRFYRLGNGGQA